MFIMELMVLYDLKCNFFILSQTFERKNGFLYDLDRDIFILGHIPIYQNKKASAKASAFERSHVSATQNKKASAKASAFCSGDGGIRTRVPRRANAFRVRPVMTTSIRLHNIKTLD